MSGVHRLRGLAAAGLVLAASACGGGGDAGGDARVAAAPPAKLRIQSGYGLAVPVIGETIVHFAERMAATSPDLELRVYDAGKLVAPLEILDAVSSGKLDAGISWPAYWMGKVPAAAVFAAVPFGPDAGELLSWIQQGGGLEIWRAAYAPLGVIPIPCGVLAPEASGWFRHEIRDVADLRGLKVRYGGLAGKVLERLGASTTMLAAGDLFLALERGMIDATEYSMPAVDQSLGFYKVAKHYYVTGWHQPSSILELVVNEKRWRSLDPRQRAQLETACGDAIAFSLARGLAVQGEALAFFEAHGVTLHEWPPEVLATLRETTAQVMAEMAASDPQFAAAWESLQAFQAREARWRAMAWPR